VSRADARVRPTWLRLCPLDLVATAPLGELARVLADPEIAAELARGAAAAAYPEAVLARLRQAGLMRLFAEAEGEASQVTYLHQLSLLALAAAVDGALAITLGVNALALLPSYAFATPAQQGRVFARVRAGAFSSLLLTELDAGSDLLAGKMRAVPEAGGGYRLDGEKDLINGGTRHAILHVLARTQEQVAPGDLLAAAGAFSMFVVDREATPGVHAKPRWRTLPAPAADISGVRFDGARVGAEARLGDDGDGFAIVQRTLSFSRGGISALASGAASHAARLACRHAAERRLYGAPIGKLGAIAEHTLRAAGHDLLAAAISLRSALCVEAWGAGAGYYTAVAKLAGCAYGEDAVSEGRRVLSGRALVDDLPYTQLVRDVLLYGTFDGTSHLMLAEVARRLGAALERDGEATWPAAPAAPARLCELTRRPARVQVVPLRRAAPAELAPIVATLAAVSAKLRRSTDQALLFAAADVLARLEAIIAALALAPDDTVRRYAVGSETARLAQASLALALRVDATPAAELPATLAAALAASEAARAAWQDLAPDLR